MDSKVKEILDLIGLNWEVEALRLITEDGLRSGSRGIYKGNQWLGTVGMNYTPLQN